MFYRISPSLAGFPRVLLGFTGFCWGFTWYRLGFIEFYWVFTGFWCCKVPLVLPRSTGLLGFTGFYRVLLGFIEFYQTNCLFLNLTVSFRIKLGFTGFYWILPDLYCFFLKLTVFYRVLLGFSGFLLNFIRFNCFSLKLAVFLPNFSGFDWVWLSLTGFYRVLLGFAEVFNLIRTRFWAAIRWPRVGRSCSAFNRMAPSISGVRIQLNGRPSSTPAPPSFSCWCCFFFGIFHSDFDDLDDEHPPPYLKKKQRK